MTLAEDNSRVNITSLNGSSELCDKERDPDALIHDYIFGSSFLITSFFGLITYVPCITAMYKSKQMKSPCYTFMISMGVSDCVSLIGWAIIGVHTVTHGCLMPKPVLTVVLCFLVIGWGSLTTHLAMIAINRCVAVCFPAKHDVLFSKNKMIKLLAGSWFYAVFVHASPTFVPPNMSYSLKDYSAAWDSEGVTDYYTYEDIACCSLVFLMCLVCYASIMIKFARVRRQVAPNSVTTGSNGARLSSKDKKNAMFQFRLAIQTAVRCLTFFVYDVLYYVVPEYSTDRWAIFVCSTYLWCLNNALNPWVYLIFNEQLRKVLKCYLTNRPELAYAATADVNTSAAVTGKAKTINTVHAMVNLTKPDM